MRKNTQSNLATRLQHPGFIKGCVLPLIMQLKWGAEDKNLGYLLPFFKFNTNYCQC